MSNDNKKKRPVWVQLELFPEMKASRGGDQSVTNKTDKAK
jgi:hypothetical protein